MHVLIALAYHRSLLSLPLVIHVDDLAIIGPDALLVDSEAAAFAAFLLERGVSIKELKVRFGAMVQLYIGFWWDSIHGTRRLEARKCEQYKLHLESAVAAKKYSLRELQSLAGRGQRICMTGPPGSNVLLANLYAFMRGLRFPHHSRRGTKPLRDDLSALKRLLLRRSTNCVCACP